MARIRTLKPEFFTSEDVTCLTPLARLLFQALWCEADREGRLSWKPGTFKLRYLPADDCDIHALCRELLDRRVVVLYGAGYAYIPTFTRHQNINPRESKSVLPAPPSPQGDTRIADTEDISQQGAQDARVPTRADASHLEMTHSGEGVGREGVGREEVGREGKGGEDASRDASRLSRPVPVPNRAYLDVVEAWNVEARRVHVWKEVSAGKLDAQNIRRINAALRALPDIGAWEARFARAASSDHLTGSNGKGFVADFWWLLDHVAELDVGRYDDRRVPARSHHDAALEHSLALIHATGGTQ